MTRVLIGKFLTEFVLLIKAWAKSLSYLLRHSIGAKSLSYLLRNNSFIAESLSQDNYCSLCIVIIDLGVINRMSQNGRCGLQLLLFQSLKPTMNIIAITIQTEQYCSMNYTLINKTNSLQGTNYYLHK